MQPQSDTVQGVGGELLSDAKDVGSSAVNRVHSEVDARKGDAAAQVKSVSSAIEKAGDGLDANAPAWLKSAFEQGAQQVQKFADTLEQKDSRQLVNQVSDFARNSPGTFLAACAAAGFAASRIFKAGGSDNMPTQPGAIGADYAPSQTPRPATGGQPGTYGQSSAFAQPGDASTTPRSDF